MPVILDFDKHKVVILFTYKFDKKKIEYASSDTYIVDVVHFVAPITFNIWSYYRVKIKY